MLLSIGFCYYTIFVELMCCFIVILEIIEYQAQTCSDSNSDLDKRTYFQNISNRMTQPNKIKYRNGKQKSRHFFDQIWQVQNYYFNNNKSNKNNIRIRVFFKYLTLGLSDSNLFRYFALCATGKIMTVRIEICYKI